MNSHCHCTQAPSVAAAPSAMSNSWRQPHGICQHPLGSLHMDLRSLSLHTDLTGPSPSPGAPATPRDFSLYKHWQPVRRRLGLGHEWKWKNIFSSIKTREMFPSREEARLALRATLFCLILYRIMTMCCRRVLGPGTLCFSTEYPLHIFSEAWEQSLTLILYLLNYMYYKYIICNIIQYFYLIAYNVNNLLLI